MRIHQYNKDLELRIQFPSGVSGLISSQVTVSLYQSTDSSGGSGADSAINLSGLVGVSEVSSTGIYRVNIDSTAFAVDPASTTEAVLYYAKITESNGSTVVNVPMFEVSTLGDDESNQELIVARDALRADVDTAFTSRDASINDLAGALGAIYDDTATTIPAQINTLLGSPAGANVSVDVAAIKAETAQIGAPVNANISADIAAVKTETAQIGAPVGASISADIVAVKAETASALTKLGAPAGASVSADVAAVKVETASALTKLGTPAGADVSTDIAAIKSETASALTKLGAPVGASVSADMAAVKTVADTVSTNIGAPAGASVSVDVAAVKVDTTSALTKLGAPAGASVSADVAAVKSETATLITNVGTVQTSSNSISTLLGTPAVDVSSDVAAVKTDATTLLTRLGSTSSLASLSGDLFGAVKYLVTQAQTQMSTGALPARANIDFPTSLLAPQGSSNSYIRLKVQNRDRTGQLERPRSLGDAGVSVNGEAVFTGSMGASEHNKTITITVNSATEVWTFIDSQITAGQVSGLVTTGSGNLVFDSNVSTTAADFLNNVVIPSLELTSELEAHFDLDDPNTGRLFVSPHDYQTMSVVVTTTSPTVVSATTNGTATAGVAQMYVRVLVDGTASTSRFSKDALGATPSDYSVNANSVTDGGLSKKAPSTSYAAMIGDTSKGEFYLYYKVSAGQQENLSFEIYGLDKNSNIDSLGNTTDSIVSEIKAVAHCTVQSPSLNQLGIAF